MLGAAGLAACGAGSNSPPKVQPEVPTELLDAAASLKGSSMGVLSQKLYSTAANTALDASIKKFADATGTKIENRPMPVMSWPRSTPRSRAAWRAIWHS